MDSENGRMTREEYRAQMGLDAEPNAKREKSGDAGARLILLQRRRSDFRYTQAVSREL